MAGTPPAPAADMAALMARTEELHRRLQAAEQRAAAAEAAAQAATQATAQVGQAAQQAQQAVAAQQQQQRQQQTMPSLVDPKVLGRPKTFSGKREEWTGWAFGFSSFLGGVTPLALDALRWAESQPDPIPVQPTTQEHQQHLPFSRQ
eukprot:188809-Amphidinium_carterae.2